MIIEDVVSYRCKVVEKSGAIHLSIVCCAVCVYTTLRVPKHLNNIKIYPTATKEEHISLEIELYLSV